MPPHIVLLDLREIAIHPTSSISVGIGVELEAPCLAQVGGRAKVMSVNIPVILVDGLGNANSDNVHSSPCIEVVVVGPSLARKAIALLDSGATGIYGDPPLLELLSLPVVKRDTVFAIGMAHETNVHSTIFWIEDIPDLLVEVQAVPCRSQGKPYDLVLGRSFLTMFEFGFDPRMMAWKLVLLGQSKADNSNRQIPRVL